MDAFVSNNSLASPEELWASLSVEQRARYQSHFDKYCKRQDELRIYRAEGMAAAEGLKRGCVVLAGKLDDLCTTLEGLENATRTVLSSLDSIANAYDNRPVPNNVYQFPCKNDA